MPLMINLRSRLLLSYLKGTDWYANDQSQYTNANTAVGEPDEILPFRSSPAHDGINIYGDEVSLVQP